MNRARIFEYENRLARTLVREGGFSAEEGVRRAEAELALVRPMVLSDIDRMLGEIYEACAEAGPETHAWMLERLLDRCDRIVRNAALFGLEDLGHAATSLMVLISQSRADGGCDARMLAVHVDGLRLLRHPQNHDAAVRLQMLSGLGKLSGHYPVDLQAVAPPLPDEEAA